MILRKQNNLGASWVKLGLSVIYWKIYMLANHKKANVLPRYDRENFNVCFSSNFLFSINIIFN